MLAQAVPALLLRKWRMGRLTVTQRRRANAPQMGGLKVRI
jgi:hypothetical protein